MVGSKCSINTWNINQWWLKKQALYGSQSPTDREMQRKENYFKLSLNSSSSSHYHATYVIYTQASACLGSYREGLTLSLGLIVPWCFTEVVTACCSAEADFLFLGLSRARWEVSWGLCCSSLNQQRPHQVSRGPSRWEEASACSGSELSMQFSVHEIYKNTSCDPTVLCSLHYPPLATPWARASSNTVCWSWQVSAKDEICHRGGQLSQGYIEKLDIQARVVADTGTPGDNGVLHAVGDITDSRLCCSHHVNQLFSICLKHWGRKEDSLCYYYYFCLVFFF